MGILDATSPTGPYLLDTGAHNDSVRTYFLGAGVPSSQVGDVLTTYVSGGGGTMAPTKASTSNVVRLISTVTRQIGGIPVVDSWAAASVRTTGDVDWESVFWPPVDAGVAAAAAAFGSRLSDPAEHAKFTGALPDSVRSERGVVIHHTRPNTHAASVAYVAFDVFLGDDNRSGERHFDANGREFKLPSEIESSPGTPR